MSKPLRSSRRTVEQDADLLAFARRAAEQGILVQLPALGRAEDLPEPVDMGGVSLSDMVVQLRRCEP